MAEKKAAIFCDPFDEMIVTGYNGAKGQRRNEA